MEEITKALEQIIEEQVEYRTAEFRRKWHCANNESQKYAESLKLIVDEFNLEDKIQDKLQAAINEYNDKKNADALNGEYKPSFSTNRAEWIKLQWRQAVEMLKQARKEEQ